MKPLNVIIGMETSGMIREAFTKLGHNAVSCDLLPTEKPGKHYECDIMKVIRYPWDLAILHPECTYVAGSGLHWNKRIPGRAEKTKKAIQFWKDLVSATEHIPYTAMENPIGILSTEYRKPDQIIQPYEFGEDASKATCLWLKGLPKLIPTVYFPPRIVNGMPRWSNQTNSGQNRLPPSAERWKIPSRTYPGIAQAIATQWSLYILNNQS